MYGRIPIPTAALLLLLAASSAATTWTVARDGTGDFIVLQDAVDAASSGDVIMIGPGRYDEYQTIEAGNLLFDLHVLIPDGMSLTFVGSGAEQTRIGPADAGEHANRTYGIGALYGVHITVRDLTIENCNMYGIGISSGSIDVEDCHFTFDGDYLTVTNGVNGGFTQGAVLRRCLFQGLFEGVSTIDSPSGVIIDNCEFIGCRMGIYAWTSSSSDVSVLDSHFACELASMGFAQGAGGLIQNCTQVNCELILDASGQVDLFDSSFTRDDGGQALYLGNSAPVTMERCILESNGPVIWARSYGGGTFRDNHLLQTGDDFWVECSDGTNYYSDLDLSGNYWGTTDLEEIAAGIWDCHDSDNAYHCVIFEPIADGPVRVEAQSWSAVKALFRGVVDR